MEDWRIGGFGLYVHWPFCQAKCPYCDFNSHVAAAVDQGRWMRAYLAEIDRIGAEVPGRILDTIFFGGGTPSLMKPEVVAAIIERARATWPTANELEVTLEANPTSVEAGRFCGYRQAGVNRVSIGVQAFNDVDLQRLGRMHSVAEAMGAIDLARDVFERVSFDLIYARQDQSLADWRAELGRALLVAGDHLSMYQLTIEDGTAFGARLARGGLAGLPGEDLAADMFEVTQEMTAAAGLPAYEVSNHAVEGSESRHNLIYWRCGDYAGIGPGAHGRLTRGGERVATETYLAPGKWLVRVEGTGSGEAPRVILSGAAQAGEYLMMGLRLSEGVNLDRFCRLNGANLSGVEELAALGLIEIGAGRLRATSRGRLVLNQVIGALLPDTGD
ncbi:MAG: coproporphyrinogen III oxidase [Rhodobacteraceae bacterium]|nr:coproporphyrinogen III oxidase [Paracoccaceae bacterium]